MNIGKRRIGRIVIEEAIGAGGMGEVFRGFDKILQRPVAVKCLRAERRLDADSKARFLREARILSKLDHPGICRIYDLIETEDADYLVLEYIEGTTLDTLADDGRDGRDGRHLLSALAEVARALEAAHDAGIVHRDLKPANVIVTPRGTAKILDFGIARSVSAPPRWDHESGPVASADDEPEAEPAGAPIADAPDDGGMTTPLEAWGADEVPAEQWAELTTRGLLIGTISYMSPEQAAGEPVTPASDMYALGIMMQELLTCERAYGNTSGPSLWLQVTRGDTRPAAIEDGELRSLVEALKARDPEDRPDAARTAETLESILDRPVRRRRRRRQLLSLAAAMVLAGAAALLVGRAWLASPPLLDPDEQVRLAVMPLLQGSAERGQVVVGELSQLVGERLADSDRLRVVSPGKLGRTLDELAVEPEAGGYSEAGRRRLSEALGCRFVIEPRIQPTAAGYRLTATVRDEEGLSTTLEIVGQEPSEMAVRLGDLLRHRLTGPDPDDASPAPFSSNPLATKLYAMGVERLLTLGAASARPYFSVCLDLDPGLRQARFQLATCAQRLSEWDRARSLAREVAEAARASGDTHLAAQAVQLLGIVAFGTSDLDEAEARWTEALELFRDASEPAGAAQALNGLGVVSFHRGRLDDAAGFYEEALRVAAESGARLVEGEILINRGRLAVQRRDPAAARPDLERALEIFRRIGYRQREAVCLQNIAAADWMDGALDSARERMQSVMSIARETGDRTAQGQAADMLGVIEWSAGNLEEAERWLEAALEIHRELGDTLEEARALGNLGGVKSEGGHADEALAIYRRSLEMAETLGADFDVAMSRISISGLLLEKDRLTEARRELERAREWVGETPDFLDVEARLEYLAGRARRAVRLGERAKKLAGGRWTPEQEQRLVTYRAAVGRR